MLPDERRGPDTSGRRLRRPGISQRARNGHTDGLQFEESVDGYVPYAGSLYDTLPTTIAKIKATMVSCGSATLRRFHQTATLVEVSHQSYLQNSADVRLRDRPTAPER